MRAKRIVVATAAMSLVVAACGGGGAPTPEDQATSAVATSAVATSAAPPDTAPATTAATTAPPTTASTTLPSEPPPTEAPPAEPAEELESVIGGTAVGEGWLAEPGRYTTDRLGAALVFDMAEPVAFFDHDGLIFFQHPDMTERDIIVVANFLGIIAADEIGTHPPHEPPIPVNTVDVPADMTEWFAAAAQVTVDSSGEATLPAGTAPYWDVSVDPSLGDTFECFLGACVANLVAEEGGAWVFGDEYLFRIYQLNGAMYGKYVFVQAHPDNFEAVTSLSELVVGGMSIAG